MGPREHGGRSREHASPRKKHFSTRNGDLLFERVAAIYIAARPRQTPAQT